MRSMFRKAWVEARPFLRAALYAALAASIAGAVAFAAVSALDDLIFGFNEIAAGNMQMRDMTVGLLGSVLSILISLLIAPFVTVPLCMAAAVAAFPFAQRLGTVNPKVFGVIGFAVGSLVWLILWGHAPTMNLYFGPEFSMFAIGGLAGGAGGWMFARHFPRL